MGLEVFVNILGDGVESVAKTPRNGASNRAPWHVL
jgi:hypothetical protein